MSQDPGGITVGDPVKFAVSMTNCTKGTSTVLEFGVVYEIVVCELPKFGVVDNWLTSVFCVGV